MNELALLGQEINQEHRLCADAAYSAVEHAIRAGELLVEAKAGVKHGDWLKWLEENFEGSRQTAQVYMKLHKNRDELKSQSSSFFSIDSALKQLAGPKEDSAQRLGIQREYAINEVVMSSENAEPSVHRARNRIVAYLEVVISANPNPELEAMRGRIADRHGRPSQEEMSLLRSVYPDLHQEVEERLQEFDRKLEALIRLEKVVRPVDIPPSREYFALKNRFKGSYQDRMYKPLEALRADGELDQPIPCSMETRYDSVVWAEEAGHE